MLNPKHLGLLHPKRVHFIWTRLTFKHQKRFEDHFMKQLNELPTIRNIQFE